jgi:hypothetical protein
MIRAETLQTLAGHLDFEFDPTVCDISGKKFWEHNPGTTISEVGDVRYVEFRHERYKRPPFQADPHSGVITEDLGTKHYCAWEDAIKPDPDQGRDTSMHGLLEERQGYIALYDTYQGLDGVYKFETINGPGGANNLANAVGRNPGQDIPLCVKSDRDNGKNRPGQIIVALADMEMVIPNVNDFYTTTHDLGTKGGGHGLSWPNTHPAVFKHLSQRSADAIEMHGETIHYENPERPTVVNDIADALEQLVFILEPTMDMLTKTELRIRDERYKDKPDEEIAVLLLKSGIAKARAEQAYVSKRLLVVPPNATDRERNRRGYWTGMQLFAGVVETRLALNEARPHPDATNTQTLRALNILQMLKTESDRRLLENREHLIGA